MPFQIVRNDITKVSADAIVNTANPAPVIGGGTDTAVYNAAGADKMLAERRKIGDIAVGDAAATPAFALSAKYVIHTVGPYWQDGEHGEKELLCSCYRRSLELADKLGCRSIAFPLISTGVYRFPKGEALRIALSVIQEFLLTHEMDITIAVFDKGSFELSGKLFAGIDEYIDEHYVADAIDSEYYTDKMQRRIRGYERELIESLRVQKTTTLDDVLKGRSETFSEMLFRLIDERKLKDSAVYNGANVTRQAFSLIRCKSDYQPKKKTALAFAVSLKLDLETTQKLLASAGYALSPSDKTDIIVQYFIEHKNYKIDDINIVLYDKNLPCL